MRNLAPANRGGAVADGWDALGVALAGAILAYAWRIHMIYPVLTSIKFPFLVSILALGLFVIDSDSRRRLQGIGQPVVKLALFIFILAALSVPTSLYQGHSFAFIRDDFGRTILLMIVLTASVRSFRDVERFVGVVLLGAIFYAFHVYTKVEIGVGGRLGSLLYYDANDLGMLLVCSLPLAIYFLQRKGALWLRLAMLPVLALFLLVIIRTGSRGAFLALMAMGLYFLVAYSTIPKAVRFAAIVAGFAVLTVAGSETYWTQMSTLLEPSKDYNASGANDVGRMEIWKRGMGYMLTHPLTGVGARAFSTAEGTISPLAKRQEMGIGLKWSEAHNSFVEIGAETGVFGLAALVFLLYRAFRSAREVKEATRERGPPYAGALGQALAGTIVGYLVGGFFISQAYAVYMFTIYGLIAALTRVTGSAPAPRTAAGRAPAPATIPHPRRGGPAKARPVAVPTMLLYPGARDDARL